MSTLTLTPTTGPPGVTVVTATGSGYKPRQNLRLYSDSTILVYTNTVADFALPA